ncbi:hypothetical protein [Hoeflea prorocentri]|uniref:Uncharacterized protein n=1 Tax=Hoeflea prorocentri TaxID=1922333 RepID=A0A9X3ZJ48_9HYPH|nr:hypothetical protein [Hoeflea prorocentri]MCY6382425.1 hypothetical protein [Hoeflea prorocentri]MDA5400225.1 hypothetical protein [Hoeflea prorocentri]
MTDTSDTNGLRFAAHRPVTTPFLPMLTLLFALILAGFFAGTGPALPWAIAIWLLFAAPGLIVCRSIAFEGIMPFFTAALIGQAISLSIVALVCVAVPLGPVSILVLPAAISLAAALVPSRPAAAGRMISNEKGEYFAYAIPALLSLLISASVFAGVGSPVDEGVVFNTFFDADFFKHLAIVQSIASAGVPALDPFAAGDRLDYYWLFYVLSATVLTASQGAVDAKNALLAVGLIQGVCFSVLLYALLRRAGLGRAGSVLLTCLAILTPSLDGIAVFTSASLSWREFAEIYNIEAVNLTRLFDPPSMVAASSLLRTFFYIQQHQLALCLILAWICAGSIPLRVPVLRAVLIVPMLITSTFVGVVGIAAILATAWVKALRDRSATELLMTGAAAVLSVALGVLIGGLAQGPSASFMSNPSFAGDGAATIAFTTVLYWSSLQFLVTFGGFMVWAFALMTVSPRFLLDKFEITACAIFLTGAGFGAMLVSEILLGQRLALEVQLKASFVVWIGLTLCCALVFAAPSPLPRSLARLSRALLIVLGALLTAIGLTTPVVDMIWHRSQNPEHATIIPAADMKALEWMQQNTPPQAAILQYPELNTIAGGLDAWAPIIAGRPAYVTPRATDWDTSRPKYDAAKALFDSGTIADTCAPVISGSDYIYLSRTLHAPTFDGLLDDLVTKGVAEVAYSNLDASVLRVIGCARPEAD